MRHKRVILGIVVALTLAVAGAVMLNYSYEVDERKAALASDSQCVLLAIVQILQHERSRTGQFPSEDNWHEVAMLNRAKIKCGQREPAPAGVLVDAFGDRIGFATISDEQAIVHLTRHHPQWGGNREGVVLGFLLQDGTTIPVVVRLDRHSEVIDWSALKPP